MPDVVLLVDDGMSQLGVGSGANTCKISLTEIQNGYKETYNDHKKTQNNYRETQNNHKEMPKNYKKKPPQLQRDDRNYGRMHNVQRDAK